MSSGAVAAGVAALGFTARGRPTCARCRRCRPSGRAGSCACGTTSSTSFGLIGAQVLVDPHDFVDRTQYLHARQTLGAAARAGLRADHQRERRDRQRRAALRRQRPHRGARRALDEGRRDGAAHRSRRALHQRPAVRTRRRSWSSHVAADDPLLSIRADAGGSGRGSGGMASKLAAARIASWSGVRTVIANAGRDGVLPEAVDGAGVGTTFAGHDRRLPARKLWIAFAAEVRGAIVVDDGARHALTARSTSLLPAGVRDVVGSFGEGDTVEVRSTDGTVFARGMVYVTAADLRERGGHADPRPARRHGPRSHPPRRPRGALELIVRRRWSRRVRRAPADPMAWARSAASRSPSAAATIEPFMRMCHSTSELRRCRRSRRRRRTSAIKSRMLARCRRLARCKALRRSSISSSTLTKRHPSNERLRNHSSNTSKMVSKSFGRLIGAAPHLVGEPRLGPQRARAAA